MTGPQIAATGMATGDPPIAARFQYRHQYDDARDAIERELSAEKNDEPSMTMQHFTEDADINITLARFGVNDRALLPALSLTNVDPTYYGDFTETVDLRTALDRMREAETRFSELPAAIRSRFDNQWVKLHEWISDPANQEEAVKLKLLTAPPEPAAAVPTPPAPTPTT